MRINSLCIYLTRELIENTIAPKHQKISSADHQSLVHLLVAKDADLKEVLKLAAEQAIVDQKMNELKVKVDEQVNANINY